MLTWTRFAHAAYCILNGQKVEMLQNKGPGR